MDSVPMYLLLFLAGFLACDLVRVIRQRQISDRIAADLNDPADLACRQWAANPALWCNRPGCARCWDIWGRS